MAAAEKKRDPREKLTRVNIHVQLFSNYIYTHIFCDFSNRLSKQTSIFFFVGERLEKEKISLLSYNQN
jgi:hypothetical protein